MEITTADSEEFRKLSLKGDLTIDGVDELKKALTTSLKEFGRVEVDLEGATEVSLPLLQLLCSAHQTAHGQKKELTVGKNLPPCFSRAVADSAYVDQKSCVFNLGLNCLWI